MKRHEKILSATERNDCTLDELTHYYENKLQKYDKKLMTITSYKGIDIEIFVGMENLKVENEHLSSVIKSLDHDIRVLRKEICFRDKIILQKEQKFKELEFSSCLSKQKIEHLENIIKNLELEKISFIQQIQEMENKYKNRESEQSNNMTKILKIMDCTDTERKKQMKKVYELEILKNQFQSDLIECMSFIEDPQKLKEEVKTLYKRHINQSEVDTRKIIRADVVLREDNEVLECNMLKLKRDLSNLHEAHNAEEHRMMKESMGLMAEYNRLSTELERMQSLLLRNPLQNKGVMESARVRPQRMLPFCKPS